MGTSPEFKLEMQNPLANISLVNLGHTGWLMKKI